MKKLSLFRNSGLQGVFYFVIILLVTHYSWKYSFIEGIDLRGLPQIFLWRNYDLSWIFNSVVDTLSSQVYWLVHDVFNLDIIKFGNTILLKDISMPVHIVWSCSGLKQMFVFFCIIAFYPGAEKHKLWFIPVGLIMIWVLNLIRVSTIILLYDSYPDSFEIFHEVSKYIFYFVIFLFWVLWEEKIRKK